MSRVGTIIAIIAVSISLVILLLSYAGTKMDVDIPQDNSTRTGYPVWHPPFPGHYGEDQDATIFASVILMAIGGYFAYKWTLFDTNANEELVTYMVDRAANKTTTIYFDQLLAAYSLITGITGFAYLAFDIGKIWATIGVFHNGFEVVILVALHQGGRIVSNKFLAWMILYFVSTLGFSIFLDWPYDTVWFKLQGLCQDFALAITFTRIYFATRNGYGDETHQRLFDVERPREHNGVKEYIFGDDDKVYSGQPIVDLNGSLPPILELKANIIQGNVLTEERIDITDKIINVKKLLTPLAPSQIPIIRCIGLNYKEHAKETSQPIPKFPILFIKPSTSLQNPFDKIKVPTIATNNQVDFEAELAIIIGKTCKNVDREDALQYVLGYTVGNDVSARKWQGKNLGSGQWCFSKGFDTFCPIGPQLVSPSIIKNPNSLRISTRLNDSQLLQNSNTSDMIFNVAELISFLSQGTTLQAGSLILTGTPQGVGFTRKPPIYLQHNDKIEAIPYQFPSKLYADDAQAVKILNRKIKNSAVQFLSKLRDVEINVNIEFKRRDNIIFLLRPLHYCIKP
ncbi:5471_t:CDS:2 [Funneliformis geosporum]|uniref:5471_t:CDS:1 n=1 Tax=Funneliformis geosporum TaxID=1117311 RepID=A0A9W4WZ56_9GLOM|nr:5471_t:CDS:2 [Funneliformis geosporum]